MTLVELLVTMTVIGGIVTVMATAATVTFRQQGDTRSDVDIARWEQSLALWLPTDLSSADPTTVIGADETDDATSPAPCASPECTFGSNALMLSYDKDGTTTTISYRYGPADDGASFVLRRVECVAGSCTSRVILQDLAAPADPGWVAGDAVPASVLSVSAPSVSGDYSSLSVTVTVNGITTVDGVDRSSSVSVSAGGVLRAGLPTPAFDGPSFVEARSGCGGPVTLVVDESGSIGNPTPVRRGVESFVRAFEGTATTLQVVTFNAAADVLDVAGSTAWNRYFDLAEPADVTELVGSPSVVDDGYLGQIGASGGTDWQEALYRVFHDRNGISYWELGDKNQPPPELVVFFTDGLPTYSTGSPSSVPSEYDSGSSPLFYADGTNSGYTIDLRDWWRANDLVDSFRGSTRLVGVGVGPAFAGDVRVDPALSGWASSEVPARVFLGDLVAGQAPPAYNGIDPFETATFDGSSWGDVSTAHLLTTTDMTQLGGGLAAIALDECGGTLTVQTRTASGVADLEVTYTLDSVQQASTSRINKAATFDVPFGGAAATTVQLVPESLAGSGYSATGWSCRAGGVDLPSGDWSLVVPGDVTSGVEVTVRADQAVSCTLEVSP